MVGNDIVDIVEAKKQSNWQRPGFLDKIFTAKEQQYILDATNPFIMVWRLWSMKEAAYKLYTQLYPSRFYNPKGFKCSVNTLKGKVKYKDFECYVNTKITLLYILSEAHLDKTEMVSEAVIFNKNDYKTLSKITKERLLNTISDQYTIPKAQLRISKSEFGIPSVYVNLEELNIGISISHHGNYGAFCHSCESRNL